MLVDDVVRELPEMRRQAEALMQDSCTISRGGGEPVFDPATGTYTTPAETVVYSGKCRWQISDGLNVQNPEVGGEVLTVQRRILQLPVTSASGQVQKGDIATADSGVEDPSLVGRTFRVEGNHSKTHATKRLIPVEETS